MEENSGNIQLDTAENPEKSQQDMQVVVAESSKSRERHPRDCDCCFRRGCVYTNTEKAALAIIAIKSTISTGKLNFHKISQEALKHIRGRTICGLQSFLYMKLLPEAANGKTPYGLTDQEKAALIRIAKIWSDIKRLKEIAFSFNNFNGIEGNNGDCNFNFGVQGFDQSFEGFEALNLVHKSAIGNLNDFNNSDENSNNEVDNAVENLITSQEMQNGVENLNDPDVNEEENFNSQEEMDCDPNLTSQEISSDNENLTNLEVEDEDEHLKRQEVQSGEENVTSQEVHSDENNVISQEVHSDEENLTSQEVYSDEENVISQEVHSDEDNAISQEVHSEEENLTSQEVDTGDQHLNCAEVDREVENLLSQEVNTAKEMTGQESESENESSNSSEDESSESEDTDSDEVDKKDEKKFSKEELDRQEQKLARGEIENKEKKFPTDQGDYKEKQKLAKEKVESKDKELMSGEVDKKEKKWTNDEVDVLKNLSSQEIDSIIENLNSEVDKVDKNLNESKVDGADEASVDPEVVIVKVEPCENDDSMDLKPKGLKVSRKRGSKGRKDVVTVILESDNDDEEDDCFVVKQNVVQKEIETVTIDSDGESPPLPKRRMKKKYLRKVKKENEEGVELNFGSANSAFTRVKQSKRIWQPWDKVNNPNRRN